jgi:hypothetical protein
MTIGGVTISLWARALSYAVQNEVENCVKLEPVKVAVRYLLYHLGKFPEIQMHHTI